MIVIHFYAQYIPKLIFIENYEKEKIPK